MLVLLSFFFSRSLLQLRRKDDGGNGEAFVRWFPFYAAFSFAFDPYHVWISRRFLLESTAIFFPLAAAYTVVLAVKSEKVRSWIMAGGVMATAVMSKYTALFIAPASVIYGWIVRKEELFRKGILFLVSFIAVFSPVIIYNA